MARSFNSTSDYLNLPNNVNSRVQPLSVGSISGWFKSGNAGSTRRVIYNEADSSAGTNNLFIAINDGTAGDFRVFRRDASNNTVSMIHSGSYNDDAWHCFTYVWAAVNDHTLYIDGAEVATSTVNLSGSLATVNYQNIGLRRWAGASVEGYFDGEIADIALYSVELTLADHQALNNQTKHALNVTTLSNVRSYFPFHQVRSGSLQDIYDVINQARLSYALNGTTYAAGPNGAGPAGMTSNTDISKAWIISALSDTEIITRGGTDTDQDRLLIEIGNVVHDPTDSTYPFKLYYSGSPSPYNNSNTAVLLATATALDGTWTKQGAVITNATLPIEDAYVYRDPDTGTYHLVGENKTGGTNGFGICYFTSSDGFTWARQDSNGSPLLDKTALAWDSSDVSSPVLWKEDTTWYMLYEGRSPTQNGEMGLATASAPGGPWTKHASNPVLTRGTSGAFDDDSVVPDDLVKIGSTYWLTYHASPGGGTDWRQGIAYSTDLITWTRFTLNPVTKTDPAPQTLMKLRGTERDKYYALADIGGASGIALLQLWGDVGVESGEWPGIYGPSEALQSLSFVGVRVSA